MMCGWRKPARSRKALASYRRHWRKKHLEPFWAETLAIMAVVNGTPWADPAYPRILADIREAVAAP